VVHPGRGGRRSGTNNRLHRQTRAVRTKSE